MSLLRTALDPGTRFTIRAWWRRRLLHSLVVLAVVSLVVGISPSFASAQSARHRGIQVPRWYFGIHDGSQKAYDHLAFGSLRIWDAHATWRDIETSPGHYQWGQLDSLVAGAQAHHVRVMLVLGMTPSFYAGQPTQPPADLRHFRTYVHAVMERYRDFHGRRGITAYQVWNEGNITHSWTGTPHQLARATQIVHEVRDRVDPHALVVAPSFEARLRSQRRWLADYQSQRLSGSPVWRYYDANALSLYPKATYDGRLGGPEDALALVRQVRRQFAAVGVPAHVPIWASEINYGVEGFSAGPTAARPIPESQQVANVLRTYILGAAAHLAGIFWYRYDWGALSGGGTLGNTLLTDPSNVDTVTPAGRALVRAESWLRGRLVGWSGRPPCARDSHGTYTCVVRLSGGVRRIYWNPSRTVRLQVRGAALLRDQYGRSTRLGAAATLRVDYRPVIVKWRG